MGPDQGAQQQAQPGQEGGAQEIAQLFQNVGKGLVLVSQYVSQVSPQASGAMEEIVGRYQQVVEAVSQARQGGGQQQPQPQGPAPQEAGAANVRPV